MRPTAIQIERFHIGKGVTLSKGGTVVRALSSQKCGPNPAIDAICCWFSSLLREVFSPGTPVFPSPQKPTFSNPSSIRNQVDEELPSGCAASKTLFIYWSFGKPIWRIVLDVMWKRSIKSQNIESHGLSTYIPKANKMSIRPPKFTFAYLGQKYKA